MLVCDTGSVLHVDTLLERDGVDLADVACRHSTGRGQPGEHAAGFALVLVRRGCFTRSADGVENVLDPTLAYCMSPGEEQRFDHPHPHGDDCTALFLDPELVASLAGGELRLPGAALRSPPEADLAHRLLLAAAARRDDPHEVVERALTLSARLLEQVEPARIASGRPATERARRALAGAVRECLAADRERPLPDLARELAVSPHHLTRVFRAAAGHSISRHRMRLRVRDALERLSAGERDLARVAADAGFADQSHLCRVVRQETGATPASLRAALAPA